MKEVKIIFCGICGRMGENVMKAVNADPEVEIAAGVDISDPAHDYRFPIYKNISDVAEDADVIVDFSHHSAIHGILEFALSRRVPAVICTTGHTDCEIAAIKAASEKIPVFFSGNMSIGINLLIELAKKAAATLGTGFDVEIVEEHHNKKLDAPSGTALMIADAINESQDGRYSYTYDRHSERRERDADEIGIHSVRGGNIVGEHEVIFAGESEVIRIRHSAQSRAVFASGALRAAKFLSGKAPGMYSMKELIQSLI